MEDKMLVPDFLVSPTVGIACVKELYAYRYGMDKPISLPIIIDHDPLPVQPVKLWVQ